MKWINSFYKTSALAQNGLFLLIVLLVLLVLGPLLIPKFEAPEVNKQIYTIKGVNLKYDDEPFVTQFLNSIKKNDGYLVLGTSETTELEGGNYYNFLNNDPDIKPRFSYLSGAGRTGGIYIPLFLRHKEDVKGLKVIFFINPVYWGHNLTKVDKAYWNRYSNYALGAGEAKNYQPVQDYFNTLNPFEKTASTLEYWIREARSAYFIDLYYKLNPDKYKEELLLIPEVKVNLKAFHNFGKIDHEKIDTISNKEFGFTHTEWFNSVNLEEDHRYREIAAFIDLCHDLDIEATFIIGPYNQRFIQHFDAGSLRPYKEVTEKLKVMMQEKGVDYIDATDISAKPGAFIDHQHHSSYGAYLIYQKIKEHINE